MYPSALNSSGMKINYIDWKGITIRIDNFFPDEGSIGETSEFKLQLTAFYLQFLLRWWERPQLQVLVSPAYYMPVIELLGHYLDGKFEISMCNQMVTSEIRE